MTRILQVGTLLATLALWGVPASAHHAFAAEYDAEKPVELKGTLTKIEWINPHSFIYLDVKDSSGNVQNWKVEFGGPNALLRRGLRKSDFPLGGEVDVKGYRAKSGKLAVIAATAKLPDGRTLFTGTEGSGNPGEIGVPRLP
ncbi:MAG TPA: DUF6152 family protein [Steroidobacteraceae bacterium]